MHRSCLLSLIFIIGITTAAAGQGLADRASQIRAAMDARDFDRAEQLVRDVKKTAEKSFLENNYDYLLARLCERRGLFSEADSLYSASISRGSIVSAYALWHLALIARQSGDLALERQYLARLIASQPGSALVHDARERMINSLIGSGDYHAAIAMLRPAASASGGGRAAMAKLGDAYMKAGDSANARSIFVQLESASRDDYALAAALGLDQLDQSAGTEPNEFECVRRAHIYLENRHWSEARRQFMAIIERFPDSPNRADALYQAGFTYYREEKHDEAVKWFEQAHTEFPNKKEGEQGYYWVGTALQKASRYDDAAKRYVDFIAAYPDSELLGRAYLNIVDCYRYAGKDAEASKWAGDLEQHFPGQTWAATGLFDRAKIELARGDYDGALALLTRLQAAHVSSRQLGSPGVGEPEFLRAFATELRGRLGEAVNLYLAIPDVRDDYFGHRATLRLRALSATAAGRAVIDPMRRASLGQAHTSLSAGRYQEAKDVANRALRLTGDDEGKREIFEILRVCYGQLAGYSGVFGYRLAALGRGVIEPGDKPVSDASHSSLAAELLFLGLYDEGAFELRLSGGITAARTAYAAHNAVKQADIAVSAKEASGSPAYSMAVYNNRGDHAQYSIAFAEPIFKSIPRDYQLALAPRDLAELMYPAPYKDALNRYAASLRIDPRLVLSLARQESRFNPHAKSNASARGLLQFIPETALQLAGEEGLSNFQLDDVYEPAIALRLASRYVSDLNNLFPDNPYAVAASYDTGEANVQRWITRSRSSDVDPFVAEIAIPETKDYVARVLSNYWAYLELYNKDLKPR
ncbi:MAG TPA: tetratricopeptide repeat protein [Blastocatellia bacterium]|nr:tetratricopeptide repeat protein [Blastocatellia bacterium]